jgi:hypothetical protein
MRSPTLFVLVQTRRPALSERLVPADMTPTVPSLFADFDGAAVTVLPDGVTAGATVVGVCVCTGAGCGRGAGVRLRGGGAEATRRGSTTAAFGGAGGGVVGTSFSCGCAALSLFASCRSRVSDESCASASWPVLSVLLHAASAKSAIAQIAAGRNGCIE